MMDAKRKRADSVDEKLDELKRKLKSALIDLDMVRGEIALYRECRFCAKGCQHDDVRNHRRSGRLRCART